MSDLLKKIASEALRQVNEAHLTRLQIISQELTGFLDEYRTTHPEAAQHADQLCERLVAMLSELTTEGNDEATLVIFSLTQSLVHVEVLKQLYANEEAEEDQ